MTGNRLKSMLCIAVLLFGVFAVNLAAKEPASAAPESVGMSSERLARIDKAMQDAVDQKKTGGIVVLVARRG